MKTLFTDSFGESLNRLIMQQRWWYKIYQTLRYDIPRFIKNIWRFRKALWRHYWWDHHALLQFMEIGLTEMSDRLEVDGLEIEESRLKKVAKMRRVAQLIRNYNEDLYIDMAEAELGKIVHHPWEFEPVPDKEDLFQLIDKDTPEEKEHKTKVFARSREIQEQEWDELFELLKGQDYSKFDNNIDFYEQFDGSGIRGWWD